MKLGIGALFLSAKFQRKGVKLTLHVEYKNVKIKLGSCNGKVDMKKKLFWREYHVNEGEVKRFGEV